MFDDFPADKARAMMLLASKGSPHNSCAVFNTTSMDKTGPPNSAANTFGKHLITFPKSHCIFSRTN